MNKPRFYIDRFQNTGNKRLLPLNGEVFVDCLVEGQVRGRIKRHREVGKSKLSKLHNRRDFNNHFLKAQKNAMYQFSTRFGASGERIVQIYDYWLSYPALNNYRAKRIKRKNKYYTYIFDSKGRIKTYSKWTYLKQDDSEEQVSWDTHGKEEDEDL